MVFGMKIGFVAEKLPDYSGTEVAPELMNSVDKVDSVERAVAAGDKTALILSPPSFGATYTVAAVFAGDFPRSSWNTHKTGFYPEKVYESERYSWSKLKISFSQSRNQIKNDQTFIMFFLFSPKKNL